jgi:TfoX/Sxy family transcriptional regulator of competence genes
MSYDSGLVARIASALQTMNVRGVRQKNVFGGRGFLFGKSTFAIAWGEGLIVKTRPEEYAELLAEPGVTPFAPNGEKPMGRWLVVSADVIADDPELDEWLRRAMRAVP